MRLPKCHECEWELAWKWLDDLAAVVLTCPSCGETYRTTRRAE